MRGSEFVFDGINLLHYDLNKISLNRGATINPQNKKDDKCFQYALTVALNHEKIKRDCQRISKIKPSC